MATRRYSIGRGKTAKDITIATGAAVVTESMEFTVDLAGAVKKNEVLAGLEQIIAKIKSEKAFPLA